MLMLMEHLKRPFRQSVSIDKVCRVSGGEFTRSPCLEPEKLRNNTQCTLLTASKTSELLVTGEGETCIYR
jgi:hypothetical protein